MVAPAIVLVAHVSEPSVAQALEELKHSLQLMRPDLSVTTMMLGTSKASDPALLQPYVDAGTREATLIPLDLVSATEHSPEMDDLRSTIRSAHPELEVTISRPIGPASELLNIMDVRVRSALNRANAVEVDALVLGAPDDGDVRGQSLLARRARQWSTHHKLPVQLACNDASGRATGQAIMSLRSQGRRHIAVGSLFLAKDARFLAHMRAAHRAGAIAVTEPIGSDPRILELILARYAFAAMEMLRVDEASD